MGLLQMLRGMVKGPADTPEAKLLKFPLQLVLVVLARDLDRIAKSCKVADDPDLILFRRILDGLICGMPDAVRPDWERYIHAKTDKAEHLLRMKMLTDRHGRNGLRAYNCEEKICRFIQAIGIARQTFPPPDWARAELACEALSTTVEILNNTRESLSNADVLTSAFESDLEQLHIQCLKRAWTEKSAIKAADMPKL